MTIQALLARSGVRELPDPRTHSVAEVVLAADPIASAAARAATAASERWALEMDDLLQDARVGLLLAVREWDPTRGRLAAWCARRAYQTVIDSVRRASRRQEEFLADRLEAEEGAEGGRPLAEVLADPRQDPDEHLDRRPRLRLARAVVRAAAEAGPWAEEALDRLVEAHEAGDEPAAERLRARLSQVVAAAMTAAIRNSSAAALRQRRRVA